MRKMFSALSLLAFAAVGCHAQVTPTVHNVTLNWKAVTSGGTPPYAYIMSSISVPTGTSTCPAPVLASGSTPATYTPLNSASPTSALTYVDSAASGTECYIVQAQDSATPPNISGASNTAGPFVVPTNPAAPQSLAGSAATTAHVAQPALPPPAKGEKAPPVVAKLEGHVN